MRINQEQKTGIQVSKVVYGGLLIALGILLPEAFHMFGQNAGMMFLPIQIPILIAGILLGPYYGLGVGIIVPILSCMLTGMPPVPKVYFMLFELGAYGLVAGLMNERRNIYVRLLVAMAAGRIIYGFALIIGAELLHMKAPFMNVSAFVGGVAAGIPGILIQLLIIPGIYVVLKKGGVTFAH